MAPPFSQYVKAGFSCIPIRADASKAPGIAWKEFTTRRPTLDEASDWERDYEGVALVCGQVSGNLEVLDIDEPALVRPFFDALRTQDLSIAEKLCFVRTPRRNLVGKTGVHILYRCEVPVSGNTKLAMSEPEADLDDDGQQRLHPTTGEQLMKPRTLIETRGEGGYVLTVGCSPACHPSGNLYEHVYGHDLLDLQILTAGEREVIHQIARTFDRSIGETHVDPPIRGYDRPTSDSPGDAFNGRATWSEILEPFGWVQSGESGGIKHWRRPGKTSGISATTGILSKAGNELMVVFSTNAYPFEGVNSSGRSGVTYSKFGAYALLNHRGDYQAAACELLRLGYGTPAVKTERKSRVLKATVRDAERRYLTALKQGKIQLFSLGIPTLDAALDGGVERGELVIVGGLTSNGKSVIGMQALRSICETGRHCVLVSHEMGDFAVGKRSLLARNSLEEREWKEHVDELLEDVENYWSQTGEIFLLQQCRQIAEIEREIASIAAEFEIAMVVIDHAQLTQGAGGTRYEQLTDASARFKEIAVRYNCVCLVPSQLNRSATQGEMGAHQLRESGALEQDADVVILARWPWKQDPHEDPSKYILKVCKNRNRAILNWEVECQFTPSRQTVADKKKTYEAYDEFKRFGDD